ncbi:hypothetical protein N7491_010047 [Penicillium cf. griseofulvum]|uniref:Uncharacterized protein n=1 Tax=Penicillium cf. griseofulvum TaxID=2972120 RepID=A0A9W9MZ82_9EURO|nr:hypothetical protein N7472_000380 [Penicillium cf. griseofulvum]KAJ5421602.1 hypothetical protein N7491_010047 [Penicillium cf. griseofulvum]KAJ5424842.1 hypothetical protein N7445_010815 [Penicillium cf. griseofulvum]
MNPSSQSSPKQTTTTTTGTSNTAVASSSTPTSSSYTYTEQALSAEEQFQRNTNHMGGWIKPSDLNHPDGFSLTSG